MKGKSKLFLLSRKDDHFIFQSNHHQKEINHQLKLVPIYEIKISACCNELFWTVNPLIMKIRVITLLWTCVHMYTSCEPLYANNNHKFSVLQKYTFGPKLPIIIYIFYISRVWDGTRLPSWNSIMHKENMANVLPKWEQKETFGGICTIQFLFIK